MSKTYWSLRSANNRDSSLQRPLPKPRVSKLTVKPCKPERIRKVEMMRNAWQALIWHFRFEELQTANWGPGACLQLYCTGAVGPLPKTKPTKTPSCRFGQALETENISETRTKLPQAQHVETHRILWLAVLSSDHWCNLGGLKLPWISPWYTRTTLYKQTVKPLIHCTCANHGEIRALTFHQPWCTTGVLNKTLLMSVEFPTKSNDCPCSNVDKCVPCWPHGWSDWANLKVEDSWR